MTSRVLNEVVDTDPQSINVPLFFGFIDRSHHIFFFFYPAGFGQTYMNPHSVKVTTTRYVHSIIAL